MEYEIYNMTSPQRYTQAYMNRLAEVQNGIWNLQHDIPTKIYTSIHKQTGWSPKWNMKSTTWHPHKDIHKHTWTDWLKSKMEYEIYNMTSPQRYTQAYMNRLAEVHDGIMYWHPKILYPKTWDFFYRYLKSSDKEEKLFKKKFVSSSSSLEVTGKNVLTNNDHFRPNFTLFRNSETGTTPISRNIYE